MSERLCGKQTTTRDSSLRSMADKKRKQIS